MSTTKPKDLAKGEIELTPISASGIIKLSLFTTFLLAIVFGLVSVLKLPIEIAYVAFGLNWVVGFISVLMNSERVFDLTGAITYLGMMAVSISYSPSYPIFWKSDERNFHLPLLRPIVASICVIFWAMRLGLFLFVRIMHDGKDRRFDVMKANPLRFFNMWQVQAVWCIFTSLAVLTLNSVDQQKELGTLDFIGFMLWMSGMSIEAVADAEKRIFRADPANEGKFICSGLWSISRHPNYCGEITLWTGLFLVGSSVFEGVQWLTVLSPIFVYCLINFVSGVSLLEKSADAKWGADPDYQEYKRETAVLFPTPWGLLAASQPPATPATSASAASSKGKTKKVE